MPEYIPPMAAHEERIRKPDHLWATGSQCQTLTEQIHRLCEQLRYEREQFQAQGASLMRAQAHYEAALRAKQAWEHLAQEAYQIICVLPKWQRRMWMKHYEDVMEKERRHG